LLIINSPFSIIFIIIGHLLSKLIFLKKEENLLEKKYGQVYTEYKKKTDIKVVEQPVFMEV
jgi:protein-S-isoprenylcysteine O-methyltransferase Ste14